MLNTRLNAAIVGAALLIGGVTSCGDTEATSKAAPSKEYDSLHPPIVSDLFLRADGVLNDSGWLDAAYSPVGTEDEATFEVREYADDSICVINIEDETSLRWTHPQRPEPHNYLPTSSTVEMYDNGGCEDIAVGLVKISSVDINPYVKVTAGDSEAEQELRSQIVEEIGDQVYPDSEEEQTKIAWVRGSWVVVGMLAEYVQTTGTTPESVIHLSTAMLPMEYEVVEYAATADGLMACITAPDGSYWAAAEYDGDDTGVYYFGTTDECSYTDAFRADDVLTDSLVR